MTDPVPVKPDLRCLHGKPSDCVECRADREFDEGPWRVMASLEVEPAPRIPKMMSTENLSDARATHEADLLVARYLGGVSGFVEALIAEVPSDTIAVRLHRAQSNTNMPIAAVKDALKRWRARECYDLGIRFRFRATCHRDHHA